MASFHHAKGYQVHMNLAGMTDGLRPLITLTKVLTKVSTMAQKKRSSQKITTECASCCRIVVETLRIREKISKQ